MQLKNKILITIILVLFLPNAEGLNKYYVELKSESAFKIHGLTNINSFDFTYFIKNSPVVLCPLVNHTDSLYNITIADFQMPLQSFETDNPQMKQDFLDLVKEKQYPTMTISVRNFYILHTNNFNNCVKKKGTAIVAITLGGITKLYSIQFIINGKDKAFSIEGHQTLNIRDFNLEPPTKFFGLVQVKETIEIDFNLNVLLVHLA